MPANPTKNTRMVSAELPVELADALKQFATGRGEKVRDVLIAALRRHMASPPPPPVVPELPPLPPMAAPAPMMPAKRKGKK